MIKLRPNVDPDCNVIGFLYTDDDISFLGEDMLEVVLPNGVLVSAGWYPEGDSNGRFRVSATEGFDYLIGPKYYRDANDALTAVEDMSRQLKGQGRFVSESDNGALMQYCA